jgi:hypothetical protein
MPGNSYLVFAFCGSLALFAGTACVKSGAGRQLSSLPPPISCDTCATGTQIDKEIILYLTSINWADRSNGRWECDLVPLLEAQGIKTDSANLKTLYIGLGRDAIKMSPGISITFDGGSLVWFGYKLSLQLPLNGAVPNFQAVKLDLKWI